VSSSKLENLEKARVQRDNLQNKIPFFIHLMAEQYGRNAFKIPSSFSDLLATSSSETGQDFFALVASQFKNNGKFLEFGAYNGVDFSNTLLLERNFAWSGVLVECIPGNFERIENERNCRAVFGAVVPADVSVVEVYEEPASNLSRVLSNRTWTQALRGKKHSVPGFSINTIMNKFLKSDFIDFLSIDIEGMELAVLETVDFNRYEFGAICVEHNFANDREKIRSLLEKEGYVLVWPEYSFNDYWFVNGSNEILSALSGSMGSQANP
jgi:hypothetical protein